MMALITRCSITVRVLSRVHRWESAHVPASSTSTSTEVSGSRGWRSTSGSMIAGLSCWVARGLLGRAQLHWPWPVPCLALDPLISRCWIDHHLWAGVLKLSEPLHHDFHHACLHLLNAGHHPVFLISFVLSPLHIRFL